MISCKVIEHTQYKDKELITVELIYPRYVHAELMTHRMFSRNAASSRAIPIAKVIDMVKDEPVMPIWTANQAGMQGKFITDIEQLYQLNTIWLRGAKIAVQIAESLSDIGAHKQNVNRVLEPYQHIKTLVTCANWDNWFNLRMHEDAQPEIHELAKVMAGEFYRSTPTKLTSTQWHLPYIDLKTSDAIKDFLELRPELELTYIEAAKRVSASCCAQVSYRTLDTSVAKALIIYNKLVGGNPIHASPFEHQAKPSTNPKHWANLVGWKQFRKEIENEYI